MSSGCDNLLNGLLGVLTRLVELEHTQSDVVGQDMMGPLAWAVDLATHGPRGPQGSADCEVHKRADDPVESTIRLDLQL
jgi:hypothetical protein